MGKESFSYAPEEIKQEWNEVFGAIAEKAGGMTEGDWSHFTPAFLDTKTQDLDTLQILRTIQEGQKVARAEKISQPEAKVKIDTALPASVFFIGDIHLGSTFTNTKLWEAHRQAILDTDGAYVVFLHNLVDNAIKFEGGHLDNVIHPVEQFKLMQAEIKQLDKAGKVLAVIDSDCHEGWSYVKTGIPASNLLYGYQGRNFPVLENGGLLNLQVGKEKYDIGLWHKAGPFNSQFNPEHALRQNRRMSGRLTDVEAGAHNHVSAVSEDWEGYKERGKKVVYVRCGTYKGVWLKDKTPLHDRFVVDRRGISGEPPGNSVTDRKSVV